MKIFKYIASLFKKRTLEDQVINIDCRPIPEGFGRPFLTCPNCGDKMLKLHSFMIWHCINGDAQWDAWEKCGYFYDKEEVRMYNLYFETPEPWIEK